MSYYVDLDPASGTEIKTEKKRGRTRIGYVEAEPGIWRKDPSYVAPKAIVCKYVKFNSDGSTETKEVKKGRPPLGYVKCEEVNGKFVPVPVITYVQAEQELSVEDLLSYVNRLSTQKERGIIGLSGCEVKADCPISYLKNNRSFSRLNLNTRKGEVYIWNHVYKEGQPDVVIEKALIKVVKIEPQPAKAE